MLDRLETVALGYSSEISNREAEVERDCFPTVIHLSKGERSCGWKILVDGGQKKGFCECHA